MTENEVVERVAPCPFCGGEPEITKHFREEMWRLIHRCSVVGPICLEWTAFRKRLVETWNERAPLRLGDDLGNDLVAMPEEILTILSHTIEVLESEEMKAVFVLAAVHGQEYRGPFVEMKQLKAMRRASYAPVAGEDGGT